MRFPHIGLQPSTIWALPMLIFFFLLLRRTPSSTLFPYTTLFRSKKSNSSYASKRLWSACSLVNLETRTPKRSEEHTSELQSHSEIVCGLVLEKKKKKKKKKKEKKKKKKKKKKKEKK